MTSHYASSICNHCADEAVDLSSADSIIVSIGFIVPRLGKEKLDNLVLLALTANSAGSLYE